MAGILGLGIYEGRPELARDVIASEATGCLLFERALRFAAEIKAARPDMVIIGRDYLSVEDQKSFVRSPEPGLAGLNWAIRLCSQYPAVDVWQCMNEMYSPGDFGLLQQQVITEIGFVEGCMMMNKTACILNFAYGSYPTNDPGDTRRADWPRFLGIIRPLLEHKAKPWLGLHAYSRDARARMDVEPEWNALRHRFLVRDLRAAGVTVPPITITEYGQADGWRPWLSPEQCMADFVWFGSEVLRDIAAGIDIKVTAAFSDGDSGGFYNFDIYGAGLVDSIAAWNRTHPVLSVPKPKEEAKVGSIAVALLPSNQDRNISPAQPSYNEHGGMHWLSPLIEAACKALGINARTFQAGAESSDNYKLQHLHEQQDAAMAWLKQQPEQWKAAVNFHTDSGDFSHTYAIYGTTREQRSKLLAEAIGPLVQQALGTTAYRAFDKLGTIDYNTYVFYQSAGPNVAAVLIELCSHVHAKDINTLFARPQAVAEAIARGIATYAGLTSGVNWEAKANEYKALADSRGVALDALRARVSAIAKLAVM